MPRDAWFADLSADGRVAFLTQFQGARVLRRPAGEIGGSPILDTATGTSGYVLGPDVDAARNLAWSPDGSRLGVHRMTTQRGIPIST